MKIQVLSLSALMVMATTIGVTRSGGDRIRPASDAKDWIGRRAPELSAGEWINSDPLKLADLHGSVVLLEFWTFGCYNCRNTIPWLNKWYGEFSGKQFEIIGVHAPEFSREKDFQQVKRQTLSLQIKYPVVTDNDLKTWNSYAQEYWPVMYLIDKKGIVRYVHVGEGDYDRTEKWIRDLLAE